MKAANRLTRLLPQDDQSRITLKDRSRRLSKKSVNENLEINLEHYIKFTLGHHEFYGIKLDELEEVKAAKFITKLPKSPNYIAGIINWHGKFIQVIDLAKYLDIPIPADANNKIIVVIKNEGNVLALLFNEVIGIVAYNADSLVQLVPINDRIKEDFVYGIHQGKCTILNITNIISDIIRNKSHQKEINHE